MTASYTTIRDTTLSCLAPAMLNGRCRLHGGRSTGPRTLEGIAHGMAAPTKHGRRNAAARAKARERRQASKLLAGLRTVMEMAKAGQLDGDPDLVAEWLDRVETGGG